MSGKASGAEHSSHLFRGTDDAPQHLRADYNEAKVELRIVDFKKIPTGNITVLFGTDNSSELFLSDLKTVSTAQ